ncbi:hypothetical protein AAG565_12570 [Fontimonas sp. SYSU GA230001]|uniref:hypothetical protein n=1 Tax=Fontimonas sp. SYSU GA230001 TaxID=3142450 RepID=UPI0032B3F827
MDLREAETLVEELRRLMDGGPGENPAGLQRVSEICWTLHDSERCNPNLADRLAQARRMFELWFSLRAWQQWGADGTGARALLGDDLRHLDLAVAACFGEDPGQNVPGLDARL